MLLGFLFHLFIIINIVNSSFFPDYEFNTINDKEYKINHPIERFEGPLNETPSSESFIEKDKERKENHSRLVMTSSSNHGFNLVSNLKSIVTFLLGWNISDKEEEESESSASLDGDDDEDSSHIIDELGISREMRYDLLLKELSNAIPVEDMSTFPIGLIADYSFHDPTIDEYSDRIRKELKKVTGKEITFDLYSPDFISNLLEMIESSKDKFISFHKFWYDLIRFLFKYALLMRKKFANGDILFEKSVENIKNIMIIIDSKLLLYLNVDELRSMINFDFSIFKDLVKYEVFDYPKLLELFAKDIIDKEADSLISIDGIETIFCNGNFNNNPLLMMMLIQFAFDDSAQDRMIEKGWIKEKKINYSDYYFAIALHDIYSKKEGREHGNETSRIESLYALYMSQSMVKFFIHKNLRFQISTSQYLVQFLRRLEHIGGLPEGVSSINKIIKFKCEKNKKDKHVYYKWDKEIFKAYLREELELRSISKKEYNRFIKLAE